MPSDLTSALEASLAAMDAGENPLSEVDPKSLDILWHRVTEKLALGVPGEIADSEVLDMALRLRVERLRWNQEEETGTRHTARKKAGAKAPAAPPTVQEW